MVNWNGALPPFVAALRDALLAAGHQAYPVGGCVRDLLLGRTPGDWDVTTSARPEEVLALFPQAIPTGLAHGTVTVPTEGGPVEITTFRREGGYSDGRHPDRVDFVPSLEEDLARRDFTINAMALDPVGAVIDPFGGRADLEARVIRCVGDPAARFGEDRLRMFRALRFAAQLDFALHPTVAGALAHAPSPAGLARERVRVEVDKALLSSRPQWVGEMVGYGLLAPWLGGAPAVDTAPLRSLPPQPLARWAGLLALLDRAGAAPLPLIGSLVGERRLRLPLERGLGLWRAGLPRDGRGWRHALARLGEDACAAGVWMALALGDPLPEGELTSTLGERPCLTVAGLALSGGELAQLGLSGPDIGAAQARLLDHVLDRPEDNTRAALLALLNL